MPSTLTLKRFEASKEIKTRVISNMIRCTKLSTGLRSPESPENFRGFRNFQFSPENKSLGVEGLAVGLKTI